MRSVLLVVLMLGFTNVAYAKNVGSAKKKAEPSRVGKAMFPTYYELMKLSPRVRTVYLRNLAKAIGDFERATHGPLTQSAEMELRQTEELFAMMSFLPQATAADAPGYVGVPKFRSQKPRSGWTQYSMSCQEPYVWSYDVGSCVVAGSQKDLYGDYKKKSADLPCSTGERVGVKGWYGYTSYCMSRDALSMAGETRADSLREGTASYANAAESGSGLTAALSIKGGTMQRALNASFGSAGPTLSKQTELATQSTGTSLIQSHLSQQSLPSLDHRDVEAQVTKAVKAEEAKGEALTQAHFQDRNLDTPDVQADVEKSSQMEKGTYLVEKHLKDQPLPDTGDAQSQVEKAVKADEEKGAKILQAQFKDQDLQPQTALQAGEDQCAAFRCNSATISRKEQDKLRDSYKATKNKSCTIGGMPSKYRNGDVRRGNCETITKIEGSDIKCAAKETICNPALYCAPKKKGQEAVFCVDPKAVKGHVQAACRDKHLEAWKATDDPAQNCIEGASFNGVKELYTATVDTYKNLCFNPDASFRSFFCAECDMLSLRIQNANREAYKTGCLVTMNRDQAPAATPAPALPEGTGAGDAAVTQ